AGPVSDPGHTLLADRAGAGANHGGRTVSSAGGMGSVRSRTGRDFLRRQSMERSAGERGPGEVARLGLERPAVPPRPEMNTVKLQSSSMHNWNGRGARSAPALTLLAYAPAAAESRSLPILHTSDLHARLSPLEDRQGGF